MNKPIVWMAKAAARFFPNWFKQGFYRLGPLSKAIRKNLNKSLSEGLQAVEIVSGTLKGQWMHLYLQSEKDFWLGNYENPLIAALEHISKKGMISYDVGANIGYISLVMASLNGQQGRVVSFEVLPKNLERLQNNIEINHLTEGIKSVAKAVSDKSGKGSFLVHASGAMGKISEAKGRDERYESTQKIETIALDDFVYRDKNVAPDIVKIDIEGAEGLALKGMRRLLKEFKPSLIIELHGHEAATMVWSELAKAGYTIRSLQKGYPIIRDLDSINWKSYILAEAE